MVHKRKGPSRRRHHSHRITGSPATSGGRSGVYPILSDVLSQRQTNAVNRAKTTSVTAVLYLSSLCLSPQRREGFFSRVRLEGVLRRSLRRSSFFTTEFNLQLRHCLTEEVQPRCSSTRIHVFSRKNPSRRCPRQRFYEERNWDDELPPCRGPSPMVISFSRNRLGPGKQNLNVDPRQKSFLAATDPCILQPTLASHPTSAYIFSESARRNGNRQLALVDQFQKTSSARSSPLIQLLDGWNLIL